MVRIKSSRALSFIAVALVYILGTGVGVGVYLLLSPEALPSLSSAGLLLPLFRLLVADIAATVFVFLFSLIFKNASVYDPYWSVQPIVIVWAAIIANGGTSVGGWLIAAAISFWGVRLTANWAYTFGGLNHQDWRYTMLCERTGVFYPLINFVGIHLVPTLVVYFCTLPADLAIRSGALDGRLHPLTVVFTAVSILATIMQLIADVQMQKFRKERSGGFIRAGLWRYSRHPNYLGEILMWWGIALAVVCAAPSLLYLITGAILNTLLFTFISIPMAEGRQSRKAGFNEYKAQTRVLLPIPKFKKEQLT